MAIGENESVRPSPPDQNLFTLLRGTKFFKKLREAIVFLKLNLILAMKLLLYCVALQDRLNDVGNQEILYVLGPVAV